MASTVPSFLTSEMRWRRRMVALVASLLRAVVRVEDAGRDGSCVCACVQGLKVVHFSAQLDRCVWGKGRAQGFCSPYQGGFRGCRCSGCLCVSDTAQVELNSEQVQAPACVVSSGPLPFADASASPIAPQSWHMVPVQGPLSCPVQCSDPSPTSPAAPASECLLVRFRSSLDPAAPALAPAAPAAAPDSLLIPPSAS